MGGLSPPQPRIRITRATTRDGAQIHCLSEPGTGTPVVFADPLFNLHADLQMSVPDLEYMRALAAGSPWLVFDWRGKGGSSPLRDPLTFDHLVADLEAAVLSTGVPCDIVSWITGQVAVAFATSRPDLVRRLFLLDPMVGTGDDLGFRLIAQGWARDPERTMVALLMTVQASMSLARAKELAHEWVAVCAGSFPHYLALLKAWPDISITAAGLRTPTVVMAAWDPARVSVMAGALPGARMIALPGLRSGPALGAELRRIWDEEFPIAGAPPAPSGNSAHPLTRRELEVLKLIAAGMSNAEIAVELTISQATAARHVSNVFDKLDVHTRAMATDAAHRLGMLG